MLAGSATNVLLVKDGVGKSKPSTRDLPHENFAYGKQNERDPEGVGEGISKIREIIHSYKELENS
jgi:hypothetical protein